MSQGLVEWSDRNISAYTINYYPWVCVSAPGDAICSNHQNKPLKLFVMLHPERYWCWHPYTSYGLLDVP